MIKYPILQSRDQIRICPKKDCIFYLDGKCLQQDGICVDPNQDALEMLK